MKSDRGGVDGWAWRVRCDSGGALLAQRIGNPTLMALLGGYLGAALETTDPRRARSVLEAAIEHGTAVGSGTHLAMPLSWLARMGTEAASRQWAIEFRSVVERSYEMGDNVYVVSFLDVYSQGLANTDRGEIAAMLHASVGDRGASHDEPDLDRSPT